MSSFHLANERLLQGLPLPLAKLYRRAANATDPLAQYLSAYYLWEAGLKLLAAAAVAECARRKPDCPAAVSRLTTLARPSLGHWREYVRGLLGPLVKTGADAFRPAHDLFHGARSDLPAAARLDAVLDRLLKGDPPARAATATRPTVRVGELFDRLVTHRNQEIGHGAVGQRPPSYYDCLGPLLLAGVAELVGVLGVPAAFRPVFVCGKKDDDFGNWVVDRFDLSGETPRRLEPLTFAPDAVGLPVRGRVYLEPLAPADPRVPEFRSLHPLAVYDPDRADVLVLNACPCATEVSYLCYTTGRVETRGGPAFDVRPVLGELLGRAVGDAEFGQWAARAQAEEPAPAPAGGFAVRAPGASALGALLPALLEAVSEAPDLTSEVLREAYRAEIPDGWPAVETARTPTAALGAYCRDLARCQLRGGVAPLLAFVRRLVPRLPDEFRGAAEDAVRAAADGIGESAPVPAPPPVVNPPAPAGAERPLLQIVVQRVMHPVSAPYRVRAWLAAGARSGWLDVGEHERTADELPAEVERLCRQAGDECDDLRVEFLLPRELIAEAVDQWNLSLDYFETAVGAMYVVLVRAPERYAKKKPADALARRAAALAGALVRPASLAPVVPGAAVPPCDAVRLARADAGGDTLYFELLKAGAVVGAVMDEPPPAAPTRTDVLNALFAAGIPVVAWSRDPAAAAEVVRLVTTHPLGEWPDAVRQLRRDARSHPVHPGQSVALLWDDPTPPTFGHNPMHGT